MCIHIYKIEITGRLGNDGENSMKENRWNEVLEFFDMQLCDAVLWWSLISGKKYTEE